jgi:GDP-D-mannose 3',5'-epimerase
MIGSNLVRQLVIQPDVSEVVVVDNLWRGTLENLYNENGVSIVKYLIIANLSHPGVLDPIIKMHAIDTIVHLADLVAGVSYVFANEGSIFHANLIINTNVIASVRANQHLVRTFVNVGTACSFPKQLQTGLDSRLREEQLYPANPESAYGWSKLMGCYESKLVSQETSVDAVNIYFHNVYGAPCDIGTRSQVLPALIKRAVDSAPGDSLVVWGSGRQGRAFLHVDDAVKSLLSAMRHAQKCRGMDIQIGPDVCTSIADLAELVVQVSGKQLSLSFDSSKPEGDAGRCADYSRAREMLSWHPSVSLREGVESLWNWVETRVRRPVFSIVAPTLKRPAAVKAMIESVKASARHFHRIQFCFYIDSDDEESRVALTQYALDYTDCAGISFTTSKEPIKLSGMWNCAYESLATGEIIMLCADDIRFRTKSWDVEIERAFDAVSDKVALVFGNDGIQGSSLATHSFVHREWIKASGFWLPPYFVADYCDTWLDEVARAIGRITYLPNVVTEHMHYTVGKSEIDENTRQRLKRAEQERPHEIYERTCHERLAHANALRLHIEKKSLVH